MTVVVPSCSSRITRPADALARDEAALDVAGEPVGPVCRLLELHRCLAGRVFHAPVSVNVAEQEVAALLPPHRTFGRAAVAADTVGQLIDRLIDSVVPMILSSSGANCSIRFAFCATAMPRRRALNAAPPAAADASMCRRVRRRVMAILPCCAAAIITPGAPPSAAFSLLGRARRGALAGWRPVPTFGPRRVCTRCGIVGADARRNWREHGAQGAGYVKITADRRSVLIFLTGAGLRGCTEAIMGICWPAWRAKDG
jgi:hypothetical protein